MGSGESLVATVFPGFPGGRIGAALLMLRVFVGIAFLFHGRGKIVDLPAFMAEFRLPMSVAAGAAWVQFLGGALLMAGLFTPLAGAGLAATMAGATVTLIRRGESFIDPHGHSWEASGFYLIAASAVALLGPGLFSLDALLFNCP